MMRVLAKHKYMGIPLMLCVATCVCLIPTRSTNDRWPGGIEVVVPTESLPAMTVMRRDHYTIGAVERNELPSGQQLVSSTRVIGRVLSRPVVEGQVLTESCFVPEGTGAQLAAELPDGMRAVTVPVSSRGLPDRFLLYPGSVVDVLVSFKLSGRSEAEALSTHVLRGITVLAVSGQAVVSNRENESEKKQTRKSGGSGVQVTLLVSSKQAEVLQLAVENASSIMLSIPRTTGYEQRPRSLSRTPEKN